MNSQAIQNQAKQVLDNPYICGPTPIVLKKAGPTGFHLYHSIINTGAPQAADQVFAGSVVANPDVMGSSAFVIPCSGLVGGKPSQRLLCKASSPNAPSLLKTIDLVLPQKKAGASSEDDMYPALTLHVTDGLQQPGSDIADGWGKADGSAQGLALTVSPDSVVMGPIDPATMLAMTRLGFDWSSILNVAKVVVPALASTGYQIYQELSKAEQESAADGVDGWLDVVGSIAKAAVPIAGQLLPLLL